MPRPNAAEIARLRQCEADLGTLAKCTREAIKTIRLVEFAWASSPEVVRNCGLVSSAQEILSTGLDLIGRPYEEEKPFHAKG